MRFRVMEELPEQRQYHLAQLKSLRLDISGRFRQKRFFLSGGGHDVTARGGRATYHLFRPAGRVEDAEIRGYLDGRIVHHDINQGSAYHFRLGRRFTGGTNREFEIKRVVMRWYLDDVPRRATVVSADVRVTAEDVSTASPIFRKGHFLPLHVFMYPLSEDWVEGNGGEKHDNYTSASPGEVTWAAVRHGEKNWSAPGALQGGEESLASGVLQGGLQPVVLHNRRFNRFIDGLLRAGKPLNVLLKLDDQEEDRWGTEMGFFASEFGDGKDYPSKRPRLDLLVDVPYPLSEQDREFRLDPGQEKIFKPAWHPGSKVLLAAELVQRGKGMAPEIWVRGGKGGFDPGMAWTRLRHPVIRDWDWSQYKLSAAPNALSQGQKLELELQEYWVTSPEKNRPHLMLLAPSGKVRDLVFDLSRDKPYAYDIAFAPDESGLWRYIWYFQPTREATLHSHENTGLFFVRSSSVGEVAGSE